VISKVKKNTRILLAEDTMFFVKQISKILIEAGIEVTHAPDGESAYQMLEEAGPKHFSLIISDIEMPKLDGFSLAKKIKSHEFFKHLPMVALTTRFKEADQARGKECGFNKYLEKLHHDELIETINELLGEVR
jgi:two-component system chemotaxis sensor kinase CheA